ncbi:metal-dependent transcriptional regulator [Fusibacter sp. 3D3]|uniref:metal-dependent transcriptional regulator n=1 Tax=Fusibacter sp. 3D3 TaxID=1048380 RepID=UPI00085312B6|nr:metal-dependent transcriptional regulator [Fusibacter sp. 3D3]GAU75909.1 Mn-dependent transcriptional regulator MntR [Fusibacter sp. 3D3]
MNRGEEDYLKVIYELQEHIFEDDFVTNQNLGAALGHTPQTVNEMIKKLVKKNMIAYERYKGTKLTETGRAIAVNLIRRHRLWEKFLVEKLGYSWESVHQEAEQLEHVTSDELELKLYEFLQRPSQCPHGNVIPMLNGCFEEMKSISLRQSEPGKHYRLIRVIDDPILLNYLNQMDISLKDEFQVLEMDLLNENIHIKKANQIIIIGLNVAQKLFVEETEEV